MPAKAAVDPAGNAAPAPAYVPSPMERLLQDLAESEHHLRHPEAFKDLCAGAGYALVQKPHRWEVEPK